MVHGLRIMILSLCINAAIMLSANAQQTPLNSNPNGGEIQQLRQEMKGLEQQSKTIHLQIQQLIIQIKSLRDNERSVEEKLKVDHDRLQSLR